MPYEKNEVAFKMLKFNILKSLKDFNFKAFRNPFHL